MGVMGGDTLRGGDVGAVLERVGVRIPIHGSCMVVSRAKPMFRSFVFDSTYSTVATIEPLSPLTSFT